MMSFAEVSSCNVCGNNEISTILEMPEYPLILRPLPEDKIQKLAKKSIPKSVPLRFGICNACSHMILLLKPSDAVLKLIYDICYETFVPQLTQNLGTTFADHFVDHFEKELDFKNGSGKLKVLEVGCFDGYLLSRLAEKGFEVCGCDPSEGAEIGLKRGLNIIRDYYSPDLFPSGTFDALVNRHVIEHLEPPSDFIASFKKVLEPNGKVFIETPNGGFFLEHGLLDPFHPEHLSVFTPASLVYAMEGAGFSIERVIESDRNQILIGTLPDGCERSEQKTKRCPDPSYYISKVGDFKRSLSKYLGEIKSFITEQLNKNSRVALWGAGSFGVKILTLFGTLFSNDIVIVDRDTNKHGLFFYNIDRQVHPPERLQTHPVDYILITSEFGNEIVRDVRQRYQLDAKCVLLSPEIRIL